MKPTTIHVQLRQSHRSQLFPADRLKLCPTTCQEFSPPPQDKLCVPVRSRWLQTATNRISQAVKKQWWATCNTAWKSYTSSRKNQCPPVAIHSSECSEHASNSHNKYAANTVMQSRTTIKIMRLVVLKRYKAEVLTGHVGRHHSVRC